MSLSTYAGLQAAVGTWNFNRTDLPATDLIRDAEDRLNADLRLRKMEVETTGLVTAVGSRYVDLPADYLSPLALWLELDYGRQDLIFEPAEILTVTAASRPVYWTIDGSEIAFERPADQVYKLTLRYLARFSLANGPVDGSGTNYLLTTWPSAYRAAVMIEAALWLQDDAQAERWQARYAEAIRLVKKAEGRSRAMAKLRVDPALQRLNRGRFNILTGT